MTSHTDLVIMVCIPVLAVLFMAYVLFTTSPVEKHATVMISYSVAVLAVTLAVGPFVMSRRQMKNLELPTDWRHALPQKAPILTFLVFISGDFVFIAVYTVLEGIGDVKSVIVIAITLFGALFLAWLWKIRNEMEWKLNA